jgi:branched-chain amino acid transport system ATP-binding protein
VTAALAVRGIEAGFGRWPILHGVSLDLAAGETIAVVGLNGAGKSVLAKTISGVVRATSGSIVLDGRDVTRWSPRRRLRAGMAHLSQRRGLVPELSVEDNLRLGAYAAGRCLDADVVDRFPVVRERWRQPAGTLSGGQQAVVALARALLARPRVLIADEPSAGLSPPARAELGRALAELATAGTAIVLVEQNLRFALEMSSRVVVLESGAVVADEPAEPAQELRLAGLLGFGRR